MTKYLLDSNIFIQAHNMHYHPSFCSSFWDWINSAHDHGCFYSIDKVKNELVKSSADELSIRLKNQEIPDDFFVPSLADSRVLSSYTVLMGWVSNHTQYNNKAKTDFAEANRADAALIATAMTHNYVIVTAEKSEPNSRKSIKIPDAAIAHNVQTITLYELLRLKASAHFTYNTNT